MWVLNICSCCVWAIGDSFQLKVFFVGWVDDILLCTQFLSLTPGIGVSIFARVCMNAAIFVTIFVKSERYCVCACMCVCICVCVNQREMLKKEDEYKVDLGWKRKSEESLCQHRPVEKFNKYCCCIEFPGRVPLDIFFFKKFKSIYFSFKGNRLHYIQGGCLSIVFYLSEFW